MRKQKENIFIILIILIILAISASGIYAWARYQSTIAQKTTMQVAKWSFKVNGQTENFAEINLADTVQSDHIAENKIAPGTQGCFEIELDASGSEVGVKYTVEITEIVDKPANLKFYSDAEFTKEMKIENGSILITGVITLDKINEKVNKNIYWKWAYNTGSTEEEILQNDVLDTQDAGKTTTMKIIVIGEQLEVNEQLETDIIAPTIKWTEELKILSEDDTGTVYQIPLEVVGNGGYTETTLLSNLELDEVHLLLDNNEITPLTKEMTYEETADGKKIYNLNIKLLTWGKLEIKINKDAIIDNTGLKNEEVRFLVVDIDADMVGSGTEEDPYIVYSVKHLNQVRTKLDACYKLGRNIDLSTQENWEPIGNSSTAFSGSFDGAGYTISNLSINVTTGYVGLFGSNKGTIKNVIIENVNITGGKATGALSGSCSGIVENVQIKSGTIKGSNENAGGIVGSLTGKISRSYATVDVQGDKNVGGIAGSLKNATVDECYATGTVKGTTYVGGLLGYTSAESGTVRLNNAFATGAVTGNTYVAALVGAANRAVITNCYAIGEVTGTSTGGLNMVWQNGGTVTNSYWIPETTKQNKSTNGTSKTISQMILKATYENWDFKEIWTIEEGNTFAYLKDLPKPETVNVENYISE